MATVLSINAAMGATSSTAFEPFGFWGLFYGSFVTVITFGIALMVQGRKTGRGSRIGRAIAVAGLVIFGALVAMWIAAWGLTPLSLEGAWIYPLAAVPLVAAVLLVRSRLGAGKGVWDRPPGS